ncbi:MAG: N-acetylglucosamine-6-phosphate deacetylase [Spirochaetia bacterium]
MQGLEAKKIFDGDYFHHDAVVLWEGERVVAIGPASEIKKKYPQAKITATQATVSPGFVDIQVNGAGGADFYGQGLSETTLKEMAQTLRRFGCTSFCPTIITAPDADIEKALALVSEKEKMQQMGVLGLHIEGNMISFEHKGAHNPDLIRIFPAELVKKICEGNVCIVSVSPEVAPVQQIEEFLAAGIEVSIAHTNASLADVRSAELMGVKLGTHLYNGMSRFSSREPNVVGGLLTSKQIYSSIIPDGNHCDFESVRMAHALLGRRLITITDGILAMGTDIKEFKLGFQKVYIDEQHRCVGEYGGLAGSMVTPIECIQNLVKYCEYSLEDALASYTSVPAMALNMKEEVGMIRRGNYADFVLLKGEDLSIERVIFRGN